MVSAIRQLKQDVISACRILSQQKLVEGFGHVSARIPHSDFFLLTPRIALALVTDDDLLTMNLAGEIVDGQRLVPSEPWLHTAIMKAKPVLHAISWIHASVDNKFIWT